jgi:hypothetical protein
MLHRWFKRPASSSPAATSKPGIRELTRKYGPLAVAVYATMSFSVFLVCFSTITYWDVDTVQVTRQLMDLKTRIGFPSTPSDAPSPFQNWFSENPTLAKLGTNAVLAMAIAKLFIPVKLGLVAYLTPRVAQKLTRMGFYSKKSK